MVSFCLFQFVLASNTHTRRNKLDSSRSAPLYPGKVMIRIKTHTCAITHQVQFNGRGMFMSDDPEISM